MCRLKLRFYAVAMLLLIPLAQGWGQSGFGQRNSTESQFSVSLPLFATLAAINAAGYDAGIDSPLNDQFQVRRQVRAELAKKSLSACPNCGSFTRHIRSRPKQPT